MKRPALACLLGALMCCQPAWASPLAPPPTGPTFTSKELAAQAPPIEGMYAYKAKLVRYVKEKRVDVLHAHFEEQVNELKQGKVSDSFVNRMFNMVSAVDEADAGLFDEWTNAYPQSYIGPLARGYFNMHRAWKGRGNKFARQTQAREFEEMHRWLPQVRRDAQLALQREPRCSLCYALLIHMSMPLSLHKEALEWFTLGMAADRDSITVPVAYYEALDRRWGGSEDAQYALAEKLRLAGHERAARRLTADLQADGIHYRSWQRPEQASEGLAAAQAALAIEPTYDGRYAEAYALQYLGRHAEAVDAFTRIVDEYDASKNVFETRSYSYSKLGRWPETMRDIRIAYEQFLSPWAFEALVKFSAGNSGWKYRTSPAEFPELCKEAALRGLPIAMTCLGGLHYFGTGGVEKDVVLARQWFRRAADAGDPQGMMDLAQMCLKGEGAQADRDQAIRLWIAAAEKNHPQARGKLDSELDFVERVKYVYWPELAEQSRGWLRWTVRMIEFILSR